LKFWSTWVVRRLATPWNSSPNEHPKVTFGKKRGQPSSGLGNEPLGNRIRRHFDKGGRRLDLKQAKIVSVKGMSIAAKRSEFDSCVYLLALASAHLKSALTYHCHFAVTRLAVALCGVQPPNLRLFKV
jgi:hypothetical protein